MADIVAGDVTCAIIEKRPIVPREAGLQKIYVACTLTINPGTTDAYPTGGIPLTNMFTAGNANDTGIDVRYPIWGITSVARISDALSPSCEAMFYNGGVTAASQTLVLRRNVSFVQSTDTRTSLTGTTIAAVAAGNVLTDSGNGMAIFKIGDFINIAGFTGTAANNQNGIVTAVAAGQISVLTPVLLVNDAAGESVTLTVYRPGMNAEYGNVDVTATDGIATGDKDIVVNLILYGVER